METFSMQVIMIIAFFWTISSYLVGVYVERSRWNKLIERGILPKPKKFQ